MLILAVVRKGRKRRGREISFERLPVKVSKARRLGASSYQEPDWHRDKPKIRCPLQTADGMARSSS
jgi:hypothetical protein